MSTGTKDIQIVVNGELRDAPEAMSLTELLRWLGVEPTRVAVELNRSLIRRDQWDQTAVTGGDALEIVQFVGGG